MNDQRKYFQVSFNASTIKLKNMLRNTFFEERYGVLDSWHPSIEQHAWHEARRHFPVTILILLLLKTLEI